MQLNPPQGLSTPDSQLRADGSKAANPVSGVVPPECCRLLHLLALLLTLWEECSHICLCVSDVTVPVALTTCFRATITVALMNACKGIYSIQIFLALRYSSLNPICLCSAAFYKVSNSGESQNATLCFLNCSLSSSLQSIYVQK